MKSTLAVALSLAMTFTFIVCLPSHGYFRNGRAAVLQHQQIARTVATDSFIPDSDRLFIKRSPLPSTKFSVSAGLDISSSGGSSFTASSSSWSSDSYNGKATFFYQGGVAGSCGTVHSDSDYVVAIPTAMYGGGKFCGKKIVVTRASTGKSVTCVGADMCPGCPSSESLDMSTGAFNALGNPDEGVFDISWKVV